MAGVDIHPEGAPYGGIARLNWVGDVFDKLSEFRRVNRGDYAVLDLTAYVDIGEWGRLSARLENVLDEDSSVLTRRLVSDAGDPFIGHFRGVPRTLHVTYAHNL
jgi:outer membrane receptor protein involved in Fe transport